MNEITDEIFLRPIEVSEHTFWRDVFFDSVSGHFSALGMPENDLNDLLEFQYQAQELDYATNYPEISNNVVVCNNERVGRMIYSTEHGDLHLIELSILTPFRGQGIGTKIFDWLFEWSRKSGLPIRFYVEKNNPAMRLYERLGFKVVADVNTHFEMAWRA